MIAGPVTLSTLGFGPPPKPKVGRRLRPKEFRHWICYHDPEERRWAIRGAMPTGIETKKVLRQKRLIGDTVHLITWVATGSRYQLVGYFEVVDTEVLPVTRRRPKQLLLVNGAEAHQYVKRVELKNVRWFGQYKKGNGLSLGFQRIKDPVVLAGLLRCTTKHQSKLVPRK
jgi:hypothetical protein